MVSLVEQTTNSTAADTLNKVATLLGLFLMHQQLRLHTGTRAGETLSAVGNDGVMIYVANGFSECCYLCFF